MKSIIFKKKTKIKFKNLNLYMLFKKYYEKAKQEVE